MNAVLDPSDVTPERLVELAHRQMNAARGTPDRKLFIATLTVEHLTQARFLHPLARLLVATQDRANTAILLWNVVREADAATASSAMDTVLDLLADPEFEPLRWNYLAYVLRDMCPDPVFRERQAVRREAVIDRLPEHREGEPKAHFILRHAASEGRLGWVWATWGPHYEPGSDTRPLAVQLDSSLIAAHLWAADNGEDDLPAVPVAEMLKVSDPTHVAWAIIGVWGRNLGAEFLWAQHGPFPLPDLAGADAHHLKQMDHLSQDPNAPNALRQACGEALFVHLGGSGADLAPESYPQRLARERQAHLATHPTPTHPAPVRPTPRPRA
jgi:hypothetical protein